jgi:hypothetical protein
VKTDVFFIDFLAKEFLSLLEFMFVHTFI